MGLRLKQYIFGCVRNSYHKPFIENWEENLLGDTGMLAPGESATIRFNDADNTQYWDLLVVFDNGVKYPFGNIDLFAVSKITVNSDATANFE